MTDAVTLGYIGLASSALVIVGQIALVVISNRHSIDITKNLNAINETKKVVNDTKKTITTLEKNTNSIKDALVQVTAESEFAKGLKLGISMPCNDTSAEILVEAEAKANRSAIILEAKHEANRLEEVEEVEEESNKD